MSLSNLEKQFSPSMVQRIREFGFPYFKVGAVVVQSNKTLKIKKYLCVHEAKVKMNGTWTVGDGGWNIPSGSINYLPTENRFEDLEAAACREVLEETGQHISINGICSITHRSDDHNPYILICFQAYPVGEIVESFSSEEISEIAWKTRSEIDMLITNNQVRNAELIQHVVHNADREWRGAPYYNVPVEILKQLTPKS